MDKFKNWSEQHGSEADSVLGLELDDSAVTATVVKSGVVLTTDCRYCGRQAKGLINWGEIVMYYLGRPTRDVKLTPQGAVVMLPCPCPTGMERRPPILFEWDEIGKWVDLGIRRGVLKPNLKNLTPGMRKS